MKFEIKAKEFKSLFDKISTITAKEQTYVKTFILWVEKERLFLLASNGKQTLQLEQKVDNAEDGMPVTLTCSSMKGVIKLSGLLAFEREDNKIIIKNGNRKIAVTHYGCIDGYVERRKEEMTYEQNPVFSFKESWMLETITSLERFMGNSYCPSKARCILLDGKNNRAIALDGHKLASKKISKENLIQTEMLRIRDTSVPILKKLLDKDSKQEVSIYKQNK